MRAPVCIVFTDQCVVYSSEPVGLIVLSGKQGITNHAAWRSNLGWCTVKSV